MAFPLYQGRDPASEQATWCNVREGNAAPIGRVVFPGTNPVPWPITTNIPKEEIAKATQATIKFIMPFIAGCFDYSLASGKSGQTPFIFQLRRNAGTINPGETVPLSELRIVDWPLTSLTPR